MSGDRVKAGIGVAGGLLAAIGMFAARSADDCGRVAGTTARLGSGAGAGAVAGLGDDLGRLGSRGASFGSLDEAAGVGRLGGASDDALHGGAIGRGSLADDALLAGAHAEDDIAGTVAEGSVDVATETLDWALDDDDVPATTPARGEDLAQSIMHRLARIQQTVREPRILEPSSIDALDRSIAESPRSNPIVVVGRAATPAREVLAAGDEALSIAGLLGYCAGRGLNCVVVACEDDGAESATCVRDALSVAGSAIARSTLREVLHAMREARDASESAPRIALHRLALPEHGAPVHVASRLAPGARP